MRHIKNITAMTFLIMNTVSAEVIIDGTLGGGVKSLDGPVYQITENLGKLNGINLFHSFSRFDIRSGEHARFSSQPSTQNIFARVTGGASSLINGEISGNSAANLWLLNPAGWILGSEANINLQGAFHLSTADGIGFGNNETFFADPDKESALSFNEAVDYQFTQTKQPVITLDNTNIVLEQGQAVSIVGGDITLNNAHIRTSGGRITLASHSGAGQWQINENGIRQLQGEGGAITLQHEQLPDLFEPTLSSSDVFNDLSSGGVQIIADQIYMKNAIVLAQAWADRAAGDTVLHANTIHLDSSFIVNDVEGSQNAGKIKIFADQLILQGASKLSTSSSFFTTGHGGDLEINLTGRLELTENSGIESNAEGNDGGNITVHAQEMYFDDSSRIRLATQSDGDAGDLNIDTGVLSLTDDGTLDTASANRNGTGRGGDIVIAADIIKMSGQGLMSSESAGKGNAGNITIQTHHLFMNDGSELRATSDGSGATGNIVVDVTDQFQIDNSQVTTVAKVTDGGAIDINSGVLVLNQSPITTSVEGPAGNGGDILINTGVLLMNTGFVQANTVSVGGEGGKIDANADFTIASRGKIITGGDERHEFAKDSVVNVIQAAAPDGISGEVTLSTIELDIAAQLAKVDAGFRTRKAIADDPCSVERREKVSSLVKVGQGGLPKESGENVNLPLQRYDTTVSRNQLKTEKAEAADQSSPMSKFSTCGRRF